MAYHVHTIVFAITAQNSCKKIHPSYDIKQCDFCVEPKSYCMDWGKNNKHVPKIELRKIHKRKVKCIRADSVKWNETTTQFYHGDLSLFNKNKHRISTECDYLMKLLEFNFTCSYFYYHLTIKIEMADIAMYGGLPKELSMCVRSSVRLVFQT